MIRRPPISTLTDTHFPYATLCRSTVAAEAGGVTVDIGGDAGAESEATGVQLLSIVTGDGGDTVDLASDFPAAGVTTVTVTGGAASPVVDPGAPGAANLLVTGDTGHATIRGAGGNATAVSTAPQRTSTATHKTQK